jgi:phospholipid N-methyltransferase
MSAIVVLQCFLGLILFFIAWIYLPVPWGAPWVPSSRKTIRKMVELVEVKPGERVVDLGAGDGRIVILAAREFGAEALGVEIDPLRCLIANTLIRMKGLRERARVVCGNMNDFDLSEADVVTLFLLQSSNQKLKERLGQGLKKGARVVSHTFSMTVWTPVAIDDQLKVFLYQIGNIGPDVRTIFI